MDSIHNEAITIKNDRLATKQILMTYMIISIGNLLLQNTTVSSYKEQTSVPTGYISLWLDTVK